MHFRPIESFWLVLLAERKCINQRMMSMALAILNTISDLVVCLWPARILWNTHLPTSERMGLILIFSLGAVYVLYDCIIWHPANVDSACIAGICRVWYTDVFWVSKSSDVYCRSPTITFLNLQLTISRAGLHRVHHNDHRNRR